MADVVVVGQIGRELVLRVDAVPDADGSVGVRQRHERLGGKGADQAVALAQLGVPVALVGVVGDDGPGAEVLAQAAADGIDVSAVLRRSGGTTALRVDVVEDGGRRRLFESVPGEVLLSAADVAVAAEQIAAAQVLSLQVQQPGAAIRAALECAPRTGFVVADGAPRDEETRHALLAGVTVLRADGEQSGLLAGRELATTDDVREAAAELLTAGPRLVALSAGDEGTLVAWRAGPSLVTAAEEIETDPRWADGEVVVPLVGENVVDPTGAGDTYVAALTAALLGDASPEDAAWTAAAAAACTVGTVGGRPALSPEAVGEMLHRYRSS